MNKGSKNEIPLLLGAKNIDEWNFRLTAKLRKKRLYGIVTGDIPCPTRREDVKSEEGVNDLASAKAAWNYKAEEALGIIQDSLDISLMHIGQSETSPKALYDKLITRYGKAQVNTRLALSQELFSIKKDPDIPLSAHLDRINTIVGKITTTTFKLPVDILAGLVFQSLPSSYNTTIAILSSTPIEDSPKAYEEIQQALLHCEAALIKEGKNETFSASNAKVERRKPRRQDRPPKDGKRNNNKQKKDNSQNTDGKGRTNREAKYCEYCERKGHEEAQCYLKKYHEEAGNSEFRNTKKIHSGSLCVLSHSTTKSDDRQQWLVDSGADVHMVCRQDWFHTYTPINDEWVRLGDDSEVPVAGKGDVLVTFEHDKGKQDMRLQEVRHVPSLAKNLFSTDIAISRGYEARHTKKGYLMYDPSNDSPLFLATRHEGLLRLKYHVTLPQINKGRLSYPVSAPPVTKQTPKDSWRLNTVSLSPTNPSLAKHWTATPATSNKITPDLLHQRFGHLHADLLQKIVDKSGIKVDITRDSLSYCDSCVATKQPRQAINKQTRTPADRTGDLVYTDICGPMEMTSREGYRYFALFIDSHSRFVRIYFLKHKSDYYEALRAYTAWMKTQFNIQIKQLIFDPSGENMSTQAMNFIRQEGIEPLPTAPNTPEHIGVVERTNRTILEGVRTLLHHSNMPKRFWVDAAVTFVFLINRSPKGILDDESPYQRLHSRNPSLKFLKVFGCHGHVLRPKQLRTRNKLGPKTTLMVYLGPDAGGDCYRMWNPRTNRLIRSREVRFDETMVGLPDDSRRVINYSIPDFTTTAPTTTSPTTTAPTMTAPTKPATTAAPIITVGPVKEPMGVAPAGSEYQSASDHEEVDNPPPEPRQDIKTIQSSSIRDEEDTGVLTLLQDLQTIPQQQEIKVRPTRQRKPNRNATYEAAEPQLLSNRKLAAKEARKQLKEKDIEFESNSSSSSSSESNSDSSSSSSESDRSSSDSDSSGDSHSANAAKRTSKDPQTFREAMASADKDEWWEATTMEWEQLKSTGTLSELMDLPPGCQALGVKWVFKQKYTADGAKDKKKVRLTARGDQQKEGLDFDPDRLFAPVVRLEDLRCLLAYAVAGDLDILQMDVDGAFLQADLDIDIYIRQPEGFVDPDRPNAVYKLLKSLYGIRQAGRYWYDDIDGFLISIGFRRVSIEPCVYVLEKDNKLVIVALYVDDKILLGHKELLSWVRKRLKERFPIKDLGPPKSILGIEVIRNLYNRTLSLKQGGAIKQILAEHNMSDCQPCATPMEPGLDLPRLDTIAPAASKLPYRRLVGCLLYIALGTRPDIAFAVNYLSRFITCYDERHWKAAQRVLRYLKGTLDYGITYSAHTDDPLILRGAGDADWGGDTHDRKSVTGFFFFLTGGPISWRVRKQSTVALSSTEAEYLSATDTSKQAIYHRNFLDEIGITQNDPTVIQADNQGAIAISKNPCKHERTKHFDIRHHFVREKVLSGEVSLKYCPTTEMVADILTKALPRIKFEKFRREAGITHIT